MIDEARREKRFTQQIQSAQSLPAPIASYNQLQLLQSLTNSYIVILTLSQNTGLG